MADHEYRDPALSGVPDSRYDDPRHNPIAHLPVDEPEQPWDPGGTYLMPIVARRPTHQGDYATNPSDHAATAGEQDHSDPWRYAGEDADPPADTGRPAGD